MADDPNNPVHVDTGADSEAGAASAQTGIQQLAALFASLNQNITENNAMI